MSRQTHLQAVFVEFIPEQLESGKLYISRRYATATHLCCCGCGLEVVTPINSAKWQLTERKGKVSLYPSIGNWSFPCQSHYWITDGHVRWARAVSPDQIAFVRKRDQRDAALHEQAVNDGEGIRQRFGEVLTKLSKLLRRLLRQ